MSGDFIYYCIVIILVELYPMTPVLYKASLTRESFLFYEMRTVCRLLEKGLEKADVVDSVVKKNLFQYPTEKSVRRMARACVARAGGLGSSNLVSVLAHGPVEEAKQVCLYALMKEHRLVLDFMVTVVGEKFRTMDFSWNTKVAANYLMRLKEQNESVASWSDSSTKKIRGVLVGLLVENGYLKNPRASKLEMVYLYPNLENVIRANGEKNILPAFNCFS